MSLQRFRSIVRIDLHQRFDRCPPDVLLARSEHTRQRCNKPWVGYLLARRSKRIPLRVIQVEFRNLEQSRRCVSGRQVSQHVGLSYDGKPRIVLALAPDCDLFDAFPRIQACQGPFRWALNCWRRIQRRLLKQHHKRAFLVVHSEFANRSKPRALLGESGGWIMFEFRFGGLVLERVGSSDAQRIERRDARRKVRLPHRKNCGKCFHSAFAGLGLLEVVIAEQRVNSSCRPLADGGRRVNQVGCDGGHRPRCLRCKRERRSSAASSGITAGPLCFRSPSSSNMTFPGRSRFALTASSTFTLSSSASLLSRSSGTACLRLEDCRRTVYPSIERPRISIRNCPVSMGAASLNP